MQSKWFYRIIFVNITAILIIFRKYSCWHTYLSYFQIYIQVNETIQIENALTLWILCVLRKTFHWKCIAAFCNHHNVHKYSIQKQKTKNKILLWTMNDNIWPMVANLSLCVAIFPFTFNIRNMYHIHVQIYKIQWIEHFHFLLFFVIFCMLSWKTKIM